ncbi:hypothetical protein COOONC_10576 [Cooperia oncophora]
MVSASAPITHIEVNSALINKIFVGDTIVALDGKPITNSEEIHRKLKEPSEMDKDTEKVTGRPIDVYFVRNMHIALVNKLATN